MPLNVLVKEAGATCLQLYFTKFTRTSGNTLARRCYEGVTQLPFTVVKATGSLRNKATSEQND